MTAKNWKNWELNEAARMIGGRSTTTRRMTLQCAAQWFEASNCPANRKPEFMRLVDQTFKAATGWQPA